MDCLHAIKSMGEKALVFTRSIDMQQLLALCIEQEFRKHIDIVNGTTAKDGRIGIGKTRRQILERFRRATGFDVLILSPDVAGIGLTITEANHVIHYGRWWNPAKESQATDRVYRIGQVRDVHVYYPVAHAPNREFPTFDEKLDALLQKRKRLAADFLAPMPTEEDMQKELLNSLSSFETAIPSDQMLTAADLHKLSWDRFESFVAAAESKKGRTVWLTPKTGDGGVDVLSLLGSEIRVIQCKHSRSMNIIEQETIAELISSVDSFRSRFDLTGLTCTPVLVTNSKVSKAALTFGMTRDVQVVSVDNLGSYLNGLACTYGDVEVMEQCRSKTYSDLISAFGNRRQGSASSIQQ
jgi:hypothetical protein